MRTLIEDKKERVNRGLAGEYYVLAQLTQRNFVAQLTLSNTKSVDILVWNRKRNRSFQVEVKTTWNKPGRELLFGKNPFYAWIMHRKHEKIYDRDLYYAFVFLSDPNVRPIYFIVPSKKVAQYVGWQHRKWLRVRGKSVKDTDMRKFRIPVDDQKKYKDNWKVFD